MSLKSDIEITDFTLRINDGQFDLIKERIGDLPEEIALPAGSYTIEAYSENFSDPKFEMPVYSGKTTVEIEASETKEASLVCSQSNAGVRLLWSGDFSKMFSTFHAQIDCNEGYLYYSSDETRTGYFLPGTVYVSIIADNQTINGGSILLAAKDMVAVTLQLKEAPPGNVTIDITIDETVNEREVEIIIDPDNKDGEEEPNSQTNPYTIAQGIARQGDNGVWVDGYIVGSITSTSNFDFVNPEIWRNTNIVLADDINEKNDRNCIFVELGTGTYRTNLNLVNNEELLHRKVLIKGNLLEYQSRPGLRNLTGYSLK